jgi:hypothetical protein
MPISTQRIHLATQRIHLATQRIHPTRRRRWTRDPGDALLASRCAVTADGGTRVEAERRIIAS